MAERRMFSKFVVCNDQFTSLSAGAKNLYFYLGIEADDDGFVANPVMVRRMCGAKQSDMAALVNAGFVILFDNGLVALTHWHLHNQIRKDRYKPTVFQEELAQLALTPSKHYQLAPTVFG